MKNKFAIKKHYKKTYVLEDKQLLNNRYQNSTSPLKRDVRKMENSIYLICPKSAELFGIGEYL